jgi:predicted transcriptional regulator
MTDKRRSAFAISRDILEVCINPKCKTRVVYAANLNSMRVNDYLDGLMKMGLLKKEAVGDAVGYHTTENGLKFLENYGKKYREKRFSNQGNLTC